MREEIVNAIEKSILHDGIVPVSVEALGHDFDDIMEGSLYADCVEIEPGIWDVWGEADEDGSDSWRLTVTIIE